MHHDDGWKFALEVHPSGWRFPAEKSWLAGWIQPPAGTLITDVRARLHHRVILGFAGLPHPAFSENTGQPAGTSGPGFSFLLAPQPDATLLRLEARDHTGRWREFFRTRISASSAAPAAANPPGLSRALPELVSALLKRRLRQPQRTWTELADTLVAALVSEPLDSHPNAPLIGALEEPHDIGRMRFGRVSVTGWLAHTQANITRLAAVIDPLPATILPHDLTRRDVAGVFPALDGRHDFAFAGDMALPADLIAPVLLKIHVELDNGERHLAFARRFTPELPDGAADMPPAVSGLTFVHAVWALYRSAGRHEMPRHGLLRTAHALWTSYREKPAYRAKNPFRSDNIAFETRNGSPAAGPSQAAGANDRPACTAIAPGDDMWVSDNAHYFQSGREALLQVQQAVTLAGTDRVEAILDLPCGYGRVARWLRTAYPAARLSVSDTQGHGVEFCIAELAASGVTATLDGRHWAALPGPYDIIWCGSLLTHFDQDQWVNHLRRFAERLAPRGVLVFTSHGLVVLDRLQSGEKDYGLPPAAILRLRTAAVAEGFGYADYPATAGYGISIAQPGWIRELIARETDLQVIDLRVAAWDQHQDVVMCTRRSPR